MIIRRLLFPVLLLLHGNLFAQQVGIGTTQPHNSAILDVQSTNKGFLPPRLTKAQRDQIQQPSVGLVVYCTDCCGVGELQVYQNNSWRNVTGVTSCAVLNVTTDSITTIQSTSFRAHGTVLEHSEPIYARGFIVDTIPISSPINYFAVPSLTTNHVFNDSVSPQGFTVGIGPFQKTISNLSEGRTYHVRAFAINQLGGSAGYGFGQNLTVTTPVGDITNGLIARYAMSGNTLDSSGNGHHATAFNATLGNDRFGRPNQAYEFNGSSSYIECPTISAVNGLTSMTISAWVRIRATNTSTNCTLGCSQFIVSRDEDANGAHFKLAFNQVPTNQVFATQIGVFSSPSAVSSQPYPIPHSQWHHLAMVFNGTQLQLYVNGVLQNSVARTQPIPTSNGKIQIGRHITAGFPYFTHGWIDDVRIYGRALNSQEILSLFNLPW